MFEILIKPIARDGIPFSRTYVSPYSEKFLTREAAKKHCQEIDGAADVQLKISEANPFQKQFGFAF